MRRIFLAFLLALMYVSMLSATPSTAAWEGGISISSEGVDGFYFAIGDYYQVPGKEVAVVRKRRMPDEEVSVVFFLSQKSGRPYAEVLKLRLNGMSWMGITLRLGLGPDIFYVPVKEAKGPPYGKAYGYYKNKPREQWKTIRLSDAEVVDFVNLRFVSEYYSYSPEAVMEMRARGDSFIVIGDKVKKAKKSKGNNGNKGNMGRSGKGRKR